MSGADGSLADAALAENEGVVVEGVAGADDDNVSAATGAGAGRASEEARRPGNTGAAGANVIECSIRIGGVDFVLVPCVRGARDGPLGAAPGRGADATRRRLWEARRQARLTQAQLAKRLGRSQAMVSLAELGKCHVGERYVNQVLEACELPAGWGVPKESSEAPSAWDLDPRDMAGIDPETLVPVRRGSERDLELRRTFVWWEGYEDET